MITTPTYHVFDLYQVHQEAILLPCSLESDPYTLNDNHIPQVSASASQTADGKVYLTLCNVDPHKEAQVYCELRGTRVSEVTGTVLTAEEMGAYNTFQNPERIKPAPFKEIQFDVDKVTTVLPPMSVCAYTIRVLPRK